MTKQEYKALNKLIADCGNFLEGRAHSNWVEQIAKDAAKRAVLERQESLYDRLKFAGLNLVDEEV